MSIRTALIGRAARRYRFATIDYWKIDMAAFAGTRKARKLPEDGVRNGWYEPFRRRPKRVASRAPSGATGR